MAKPPPLVATPSGELPIDRALGLAAAGDSEGALRWAVPIAKSDLATALPLFVIGRELRALGRKDEAIQAFETAADRAADSGNLPLALACIAELVASGADASARADAISTAYAKGSPRLRPGSASLPPVVPPSVQPLGNATAGPALLDAATQII